MKPIKNKQKEPGFSGCDLNIIVDGKQYGAHWCILREKSKFFDEFYRSNLKTKKSYFEGTKTCVHLEGISSELVGSFLQYVYVNCSKYRKPENIQLNKINNVIKFSVMFGIKDLEMAKSEKLEAAVEAIGESNQMSELHKNLLMFLFVRTTGYKSSDMAAFVADKAYTAANIECLFEVLNVLSCNMEKMEMRLRLLDVLITLHFSASLDQEVLADKRGLNKGIVKECMGYECKQFGTRTTGENKKIPTLKAGLINKTANPKRTQHSVNQNSKKLISKNQNHGQNTVINRKSKVGEFERKNSQTNFLIGERSQHNGHQCNGLANCRLIKTHPPVRRRITRIREHLQRINAHAERANAQENRVHELDVLVDTSTSQSKSTRDMTETGCAGNKLTKLCSVDVLKLKNPAVRHELVCFLDGEESVLKKHSLCENEKITTNNRERVKHDVFKTGDGDNVFAFENHQILNESTLSCEHRGTAATACDRGVIKDDRNSEIMMTNMNEEKLGNHEEELGITTRKTRKMWAKDVLLIDRKISSYEINLDQNTQKLSVCNECKPEQNFVIPQLPLNSGETAHIKQIYLTGGIQQNDYFAHKAILRLNPETGIYTSCGAMCNGRYNHGMAQLGKEIYVVGGNSGFFEQLRSVESYSPKDQQWSVRSSMREARDEFALAVCDGCLYAIGGHNGIQDLRSVEKFDVRESSWSFVSPMRNYRAGACAVCVDNRSIYVIGGFDGKTYLTCAEQYDITADVWNTNEPLSNKRAYSCSILSEKCIYIFGGFDGKVALSSCEVYDIHAEVWEMLPNMNTPRMNATAVVYSGNVYVFGGECDSVFLETVECYDIKNRTWSLVHRLPQPMAGLRACAFL